MMPLNHALQRPAIALRLQSARPVGLVAELGSLGRFTRMKNSDQSSGGKPQIVPRGYWTFWCVFSLLGGVSGIVTAFVSGTEHGELFAILSIGWSFAWAAVYWRIRRETNAASMR